MRNYVAVLEEGPSSWSAYVPDLPGCVAAAQTREETEQLIQEAIEFHLEGLLLDGTPLPELRYQRAGGQSVAVAASFRHSMIGGTRLIQPYSGLQEKAA